MPLFPHEVRAALRHNWNDEGIDLIERQVAAKVLKERVSEAPPLLELMWRCDTHNCDAIPRLGQDPDRCWKGEFVKHLSVDDCAVRRRGFVPFDISDFLESERARVGET